ncbi:MAG: hypothetical protein EGQ20_05090 [Bacteroides oleiciplenus]|nr:hypothetical protein [Bacteroides oleiciplenus]
MKKIIFIAIAIMLGLSACHDDDYITGVPSFGPPEVNTMAEKVNGRIALGYVTYYGTALPDPTYMTHINYAFAELYVKSNVYQKFDLQGNRERFDQVKKLKARNSDLKILLSFTNSVSNSGNSQDGGFSALAKSPEMRKQFAQDCKKFVQQEGIDGIDIDWEFPGMTFGSNAYDELVDVENFTLLMKDLRETLGSSILLTYAGYCKNKQPQGAGWKYIDVKAVDPYVDFVNIMTYDLVGAPGHQSPLNKPSASWDCKRSVDEYLNAGVPASKLVLGIPFYGRAHFNSGGSINYKDIVNLSEGSGYVIDNWDAEGSVPYVTKDGVYYCGYDNPRSIAAKGEWLLGLGMKGMMFWDYDGDDSKGTLRNALWNAVMKNDSDPGLNEFLNNSEGYKALVASCEKMISSGQYMAGTLIEETTSYPNYEGYPVKLYEYTTGKDAQTGVAKKGMVYMLNPTAEKLATWIATAVWKTKNSADTDAMATVLKHIQGQSGAQFPVCGIVYEDMSGTGYYPYLFKDGVTVYAADKSKWATEDPAHPGNYSCTDDQLNYSVKVTNSDLSSYTGKYARICGTLREEYTANGGTVAVGTSDSQETRNLKWLDVVRDLYKEAWNSGENKLITAWAKANL